MQVSSRVWQAGGTNWLCCCNLQSYNGIAKRERQWQAMLHLESIVIGCKMTLLSYIACPQPKVKLSVLLLSPLSLTIHTLSHNTHSLSQYTLSLTIHTLSLLHFLTSHTCTRNSSKVQVLVWHLTWKGEYRNFYNTVMLILTLSSSTLIPPSF